MTRGKPFLDTGPLAVILREARLRNNELRKTTASRSSRCKVGFGASRLQADERRGRHLP